MAASSKHRGWLLNHDRGILAGVYDGAQPGTRVLATNTALDGILVGTPVTPALAVDSLVISNTVTNGDILLAASNTANSQAWLWVDASAGTLTLYGAGTANTIYTSTAQTVQDDVLLAVGTGSTARLSWDTTDANSNQMLLQLPAAGSVDSPVLIIGQSVESIDFGAAATGADYSAVVDPRVAIFGTGAVTTGPVIEFRKGRGTVAAPTVCTTGDDLGTIDFYGAVANGEYVRGASIRADIAGTIATGRGPGTLTFLTATDAASSVLTTALTISAAQLVTCAAGVTLTTGNLTFSAASDIVMLAATAAALEISDGTTKFYAFDTRVATTGVTTHALDIADYTFASAATNVATGLSLAAHTLNYTGTTQVTTEVVTASLLGRTVAGDTATLTVDKASTLRLVGPIEGTNVTLTAASALRIGDAGGTPTNQYGIFIESLTAGATADYAIWVAGANAVHLGTAGTATGLLEIDGATSGTMTLTVPAATTSYTLTLPAAANTNVGYQLTCAAGDTLTSWGAAGSVREMKVIHREHDVEDALTKVLGAKVYDFHYKPGQGTQDAKTEYVGVVADEAPWAMHYEGGVVNPVNTLGYTVLSIQALARRIRELEAQLATRVS